MIDKIDWEKIGELIPAIAQDAKSGRVLMLGYQNREAILKSKEIGKLTFFSRSKQRSWTKGETSGNFLHIEDCHLDCDEDAILYLVRPEGPTCHTGAPSCFEPAFNLQTLQKIIADRKSDQDEKSYTVKLLNGPEDQLFRKLTEEATEVLLAAKNRDRENLIDEVADLFYHTLVTLKKRDVEIEEIYQKLASRHNPN